MVKNVCETPWAQDELSQHTVDPGACVSSGVGGRSTALLVTADVLRGGPSALPEGARRRF